MLSMEKGTIGMWGECGRVASDQNELRVMNPIAI